jgi:hypothetical protein
MNDRQLLLVGLGVLALIGLLAVLRATRHQAHEAARALHSGAAAVSLAGRSLVTGAMIVGAQWLVITRADVHGVVYWLALGLPAWLAGYTLTRAFTITTVVHRGGGGWR